ncbi:SGNH/GDSL hydrolase family protein [Tessaracoccus sp. MC1627]|uniref:SGNH/GDSL hydrolase family protein n=1 Tax=Tessaracoccus sp. MC1627 TaxID=2760312 RepID=UPI0016041F87|nr:SGNH/GDSL hydrolase family protein [Tessaracoccus sp. MC1627]MBB1511173.1 SGNH/GDSL hydrolase family protein [Tessaracoccus sp. MC1627]
MNRRGIRGVVATLATLVVSLTIVAGGVDAAAKRPAPSPSPTNEPSPTSPPPAQPVYVALGDSYAAGVGGGSYIQDGTDCYRTLKGYPGLIAQEKGYALDLQACSGADIDDVTAEQLETDYLAVADYVSITVGGNDVGFASVLTTCIGTNESACITAVDDAVDAANALPSRLVLLFTQIREAAPDATVVATAYPRLLSATKADCSWITTVSVRERDALNSGAATLAGVISKAADDAGIGYADVLPDFLGHGVCDSSAWIYNASLFPTYLSYHPTATGYLSGYKPAVATALGTSTAPTGTAITLTLGGETSSDTNRGTVKIPKSQKD